MGEDRGVHRVLVGKSAGKRPLGRPRRRWEDNIKMDLQEVGGGLGDWDSFPVYYPDVYLQLNMFRALSRPSSGAQ